MFRKPRENASASTDIALKPSTGRPPTPPYGARPEREPSTSTMNTRKSPTKPLPLRQNSNVPILGRQGTKKVAYSSKTPTKQNGSILNFFKKVDGPGKEEAPLFLSQGN